MARASYQLPQHVGAQKDEHDADTQFEGMDHSVGQLVTKQQNTDASDQQGQRVAQTPEGADQRRTQQTPTLRHNR
jgi:hypothetical protein